jgi:hypothetical protein
MTDGIDSYRGYELQWAVGTVFENADGVESPLAKVRELPGGRFSVEQVATPEALLEPAWEFIRETFKEEGLRVPSRDKLLNMISERLKEEIDQIRKNPEDWI